MKNGHQKTQNDKASTKGKSSADVPQTALKSNRKKRFYIHPVLAPSYHETLLARRTGPVTELHAAALSVPGSEVFFWDRSKMQLINPSNLTPDSTIKPGTYNIQAAVYSFHSSESDMKELFNDDANNVQLTFRAQATQNGEEFTWIVQAGLNVASNLLGGSDKQSLNLSNKNNKVTDFASPADQITVTDGAVSLWIGLAAQKKDSWWDTFLKAIHLISDSPLFALVPMAKLASMTANAVDQMTQQIEEHQKLTTIITGNRLDFTLYPGTSQNPFTLRPGFWVVMNHDQADRYVDYNDNENIRKGVILDIAGQQYNIVDTANGHKPIDVTYAVANISLAPKTS
jgi:hypothetical protein